MIQAGLAWHYKRYAREQPAEEAKAYALAEELARVQLLALWQEERPKSRRGSGGQCRAGVGHTLTGLSCLERKRRMIASTHDDKFPPIF
jgi:hypothetical protein